MNEYNLPFTLPTIESASTALLSGQITSRDLVESSIRRANRLDGVIATYISRFDTEALAAADAADDELAAGNCRGPLHGVPIAIKDMIAAKEGPTTGQSSTLAADWWSGIDSPVVSRLRNAGAVITGKTTTLEFASGFPPLDGSSLVPRNPWNVEAWSGGSSSGSGNGLAVGIFAAALGTDTGASIRMPAAFCGISGLLPTYGSVSNSKTLLLSPSLDRTGPMAHTALDCRTMFRVMRGIDNETSSRTRPDSLSLVGDLSGLRVGVVRNHHFPEGADPICEPVFDRAIMVLSNRGAIVTEVDLPLYQETTTAAAITSYAEGFNEHRSRLAEKWKEYLPGTKRVIGLGAFVGAADYIQAQKVRMAAQEKLSELFRSQDILVMPTASAEAFDLKSIEKTGLLTKMAQVHTFYWNAVGNPVLALPMGVGSTGLPLGMQIAGRPFEEEMILDVGEQFQNDTKWHLRVPPMVKELI